MKKSAETTSRYGLGAYIHNAGLDVNDEPESVSKTLEYAYDDWCIAKYASLQYSFEDANVVKSLTQFWKNSFDRSTRFMRPKIQPGVDLIHIR